MLLKLKYFLKTNSTVRALDEFEYLDACEKLNPFRMECEKCRDDIMTTLPYDVCRKKGIEYCLRKDKDGTIVGCWAFDTQCGCVERPFSEYFAPSPFRCPMYSANQKYIRARDAYLSQQKIVDEFWKVRMTERLKTK